MTNLMTKPGYQPKPSAWLGEGLRQMLLFPALRCYVSLEVTGQENLQDGPYLFAANHSSHLDTPLLLAALPGSLRLSTRVAAAADYFFKQWWKGQLVKLVLNAFPFNRKGQSSLAQVEQLLNEGQSLLIFPEGTRSPDGVLRPFKWGVGRLATVEGVSIVPVLITGTYAAMPKGSHWPRRGKVSIHFGEPVSFASGQPPACVAAEIERRVQALAA